MIDWKDINTKGKTSGQMTTTCPSCSHLRKKKNDPCLSVNLDKGAAHCHHCGEISWQEALPEDTRVYDAPPQQWQNHTALSDKVVEWFKARGITQKTLIANRITQEKIWFPQEKKEMNAIVFNYFEGTGLINKKYRSAKKQFTQTKNAKKTFYGINDIVGLDEVYIVEGEMDKLAMYEAGKTNCISVPNGANDLNDVFENCERYIKEVAQFIIAVDMDEPGKKLEQALVKRLGKYRCKRVKFKGKDANDDLVNGCLEESLKVQLEYPVEGTFTASDVINELHHLRDNGMSAPLKVKGEHWRELNEAFSILMGQLTVITGIPSHGKSNFLEWYLLNLIKDNGLKMSFFSPEHLPMQLHHSQLAEKVIGKPFMESKFGIRQITHEEIDQYQKWSKDKIFLTMPDKAQMPTWSWLFERFEEQIFRYGVDIFVIDAFNKVKRGGDSLKEISDTLAELVLFAQMHNVHIFLVAHPTKMSKNEDGTYAIPTLYDVKGSGDFFDQTHNGGTVYRNFDEFWTDFIVTKLKFKHQGESGRRVRFEFDSINGRYRFQGQEKDYKSMLEEKQSDIFEAQPQVKSDGKDLEWLKQDPEDYDYLEEDPF